MTSSAQTSKSVKLTDLKIVRSSRRSLFSMAMTTLASVCMLLTLFPLIAVLTYVWKQGSPRLNLALLTQLPPPPGLTDGGIANAILGTMLIVGIAALISVPFGILAAVYLVEFGEGRRLALWISFATNVLSGIPSIVAGVFAYGLLVRTNLTGYSAIAGGVALSVLMLPTIIRTTDEALRIVPKEVRWASIGLGASNYQTILMIVIPAAVPSIITGVTLAIARAAGETAPLIFTALNSSFWPDGLMSPIASLSVLVYNFATVPFEAQQQLAWAGSLILILMVLITSILARLTTRKKVY